MEEFGVLKYTLSREKPPVTITLVQGPNIIGRRVGSAVRLEFPEIAEQHACIVASATGCYLLSFSPQNQVMIRSGTLDGGDAAAGGTQVPTGERRLLHHNDEIVVGRFTLRYQRIVATGIVALPPEAARRWEDDLVHIRRRVSSDAIVLPPLQSKKMPLERPPSEYLRYLPPIYHDDNVVNNLLISFEAILGPLERMSGDVTSYVHPWTAPISMLPWLASWVGIVIDTDWPPERQRALLSGVARLYPWRGTKHGLSEILRLYTGRKTEIIESQEPTKWPADVHLDSDTFLVLVPAGSPPVDEQSIRRVIETEKPAHTRYLLRFETA